MEEEYAKNFPVRKGRPAFSVRMALGALIIQKRMNYSDRVLVKCIAENPYYQYFLGLKSFSGKCPFTAPALVSFRKRLTAEVICKFNEAFLATAKCTPEHEKKEKAAKPAGDASGDETANAGTIILDATCSPSNIRYPQDFSLLNEAREKTDAMIDALHEQANEKKRPRTYKRVLHNLYLNMAKSKKRTAKAMRALVYKLLCSLKRNLGFIDAYLEKGGSLTDKQKTMLETIRELYRQQKEMFDKHVHRVDNRIVSLKQPYIRPIVRGKVKTPVEFGAKYDVSIDEKGHSRLERMDFEPYNECTVFKDAVERYKERTGHYPVRALVDKIYNNAENRAFCDEHGIRITGRRPWRPAAKNNAEKARDRKDNADRNEVERFFSREKGTCGAALITTRLKATTLTSIALSVLVANLFGIPTGDFFIVYFWEAECGIGGRYFMEFIDDVA